MLAARSSMPLLAVSSRLRACLVLTAMMNNFLLRAAGLGFVGQPVRTASSCAVRHQACRSISSHPVHLCDRSRVRARSGGAALRMASEKTLISKMRVKELRQELENRGLEATGIGPVLRARLGQAMRAEASLGLAKPLAAPAVEKSQRSPTRPQQHAAATAGSGSAGTNLAGEGRDTAARPLRPARDAAALEARGGAGLPRKMSTSTRSPPPPPAKTEAETEIAAAAPPPPRTDPSVYVMQFDGGSRGNPGPSGAGAVLYRVGEGGMREEVWIGSLWVGQHHTNNEAEYSGLIEGLAAAKELGIKNLTVEGDSKLVIMQMLGNYKVSSQKMIPLFEKAKGISKNFDKLDMGHIERALNGRADSLANLAMDTKASARVTHPSFAESTMR